MRVRHIDGVVYEATQHKFAYDSNGRALACEEMAMKASSEGQLPSFHEDLRRVPHEPKTLYQQVMRSISKRHARHYYDIC